MRSFKNYILFSLIILSQFYTIFRGSNVRVDWFFLVQHTRRIDYAVMYVTQYITEFVLAYCLLYPNNISRELKRLILIICGLDIIHYFLLSSIGFELEKLALAFVLSYGYKLCKHNG